MRAALALILLAAAAWRLVLDWQATIGAGYAFRPGTIGGFITAHWPEDYANLVTSLEASGVPFLWDPVGACLLSLPVAIVLAALACAIWVSREHTAIRRYGR